MDYVSYIILIWYMSINSMIKSCMRQKKTDPINPMILDGAMFIL